LIEGEKEKKKEKKRGEKKKKKKNSKLNVWKIFCKSKISPRRKIGQKYVDVEMWERETVTVDHFSTSG